ncbi:MAG: 3-phosphoserine/phosphohydroxythreonine transaminase [Planctomycetota bacterium]
MSTDVSVKRVFNFSAGPAALPLSVLQEIQRDMIALPGVGASILEISHRSSAFVEIIEDARNRLVNLLGIPDTHEVVFMQGGARLQNAMIPANFLTSKDETADYVVTGNWGKNSAAEVPFYGVLNKAFDGAEGSFTRLPEAADLQFSDNAGYIHFTSNETIHGLQFKQAPANGDVPLVCDASSDFLSRPVNISEYGMIYACAQKNAGTAGVTVCIISKELLERCGDRNPSYLDYAKVAAKDSMLNTPPTFSIYVTGLVCKWLQEEVGGLEAIEKMNSDKARLLYDVVDESGGFYVVHAANPEHRSVMNVVFKMATPELDRKFLDEAAAENLTTLGGHRSIGGIRASIYNAMPREGVEALAGFMKDFAAANG